MAIDIRIKSREDTKNNGARMSVKRRTRKVLLSISFEYKASLRIFAKIAKTKAPKRMLVSDFVSKRKIRLNDVDQSNLKKPKTLSC